jgi:hypothetical protein
MPTQQKRPKMNQNRQRLVDHHYQDLMTKGETSLPSGLIRKFIYEKLSTEGKTWKTEIVGYTERPNRIMSMYAGGPGEFSAKFVLKCINTGKLKKQDALDHLHDLGTFSDCYGVTLDDINTAFDLQAPYDTRMKAIEKLCHDPSKYNFISFMPYKKPIKMIKLINHQVNQSTN